jgi:hypothetical protein
VYETDDELRSLQELLDESAREAGPHLRSIFTPARALSAPDLARRFPGAVRRPSPRRRRAASRAWRRSTFCFSTAASGSARMPARPASATCGRDRRSASRRSRARFAVIAHGRAVIVEFGTSDFARVDREFVAVYGGTPSTEAEAEESVYVRLEPTKLYTFAVEAATD